MDKGRGRSGGMRTQQQYTEKNCFHEDKKFSHKMKFMIPKFNSCHLYEYLSVGICVLVKKCCHISAAHALDKHV